MDEPTVTTSVRETDKFRDGAMKMLVKRNQQIAQENEKLLMALEDKNLITYGNYETAVLIHQLRDKHKALETEIMLLKEKLRIAQNNYRTYINKYVAVAKKLKDLQDESSNR